MKLTYLGLTLAAVGMMTLPLFAQEERRQGDRAERQRRLLERFDRDGDGQLSEEERAAARQAFRGQRRPAEGRPGAGPGLNVDQIFARLDRNQDGKLTKEELGERGQRLAQADANNDGEIAKEELQAAFRRMQEQFNPEQLFARMDRNGDGKLEKDELRGPLAERLTQADQDQDGHVSKEEFLAAAQRLRPALPQGDRGPNVDQMFAQFDKNADGKLTKDELPERAAEFILRADRDGDEAVTKDELQAARQRFERARGQNRPGRPQRERPDGPRGERPQRPAPDDEN